jgi:hypothetical protein
MPCKAKFLQGITDVLIVITFVQAHALWLLTRGLRALDNDAIERSPHQFHVMPVRPLNRQSKRHAVAFGQQAALDPAFGAVGRIGAGFFPRRVAPWSSPRPCSARPNQSPSVRQTVLHPPSRVSPELLQSASDL